MKKFYALTFQFWLGIFKILLILQIYFNPFTQIASAQTVNFSSSGLLGETLSNPTSLDFGPDNRLYVSQQNGIIYAYTIIRNGPNNYSVAATETIQLIKNIPNHNDDGTLNSSVTNRQITGILVVGTSVNPVIYVTSSDPRIGGGGTAGDLNLDTNSGILSKLTWNGSSWVKVDLVKGLPRSEENHSSNGLTLDEATNTLYMAQGGHTNAGSPSNNFAFLTEYALSAAILKIDLNAIATQFGGSYTLPTLDDPTRSNTGGSDVNDPWGGNDGLNQAKLVAGGPVQIHSAGYRNSYDLLITKTPGKTGRMYTIDNGANGGWGGYAENEGTPNVTNNYVIGEPGSTTAGTNDAKVNNLDNLHLVSAPAMTPIYGGHPNPIRANPAGAGLYWFNNVTGQSTFSLSPTTDWPPVPLSMANPIESDFRNPGVNDGALYTWGSSTNGIAEYTSGAFNGAMLGDLLAASFNGNIYRIKLNSAGTAVSSGTILASGFGSQPLDVIAQADNEIFPGTIWAATYGANSITIFEPALPAEIWTDVVYSTSGITPTARHENGFVEVNGKFYLIGGRVVKNVNIYDPATKIWTLGAASPIELNHFQAVVFNNEIYAVCAFQGSYPNEVPVPNVYKYNTQTNTWTTGALIPANRRRGSAGVVLFNNKFYIVGGIQNGHIDGWVPWVDEYDPVSGVWTILPDAPVARDHFAATLINGKIYAAGGRQTHYPDFAANTIAGVDVYDIASKVWTTPTQIPTQRGAPGVAYINGELIIAGGEASSSSSALSVVEGYNPITNTWQAKSALNVGRHATQMISYQGKLFMCAGSTTRGGGGQTNTMSNALFVSNCSGDVNNFTLDDDADGYSNGDETANGTDPCSSASKPQDFDGDLISDLTDPDDDNDGLNDQVDKFALDNQNGLTTNIPVDYPFLNGNPGFGLFGMGFTGLMTNNVANYQANFDLSKPNLVMGGAVGIATEPAEAGDAVTNDQKYAFQFGVKVSQSTPAFSIRGKLLGSSFFDGATGTQLGTQSQGIYFGTGDQDNYLKLVLHANNGNPGFQILIENSGVITYQNIFPVTGILSASAIDVFMDVDPATGKVQCKYQTNSASSPVNIGTELTMTGNVLTVLQNTNAIAVGLIASSGNKPPFTASWDYLNVISSVAQTLTEVVRINAGGPNVQFGTEQWKADQNFSGGTLYSNTSAISNTTNDALYQTERFGNMTYSIPVPQTGNYTVELHFVELYFSTAGSRVFNVNVESGQFALQNIDLFKDYGGKFAASVIKAQNIQVNDGFLTVTLTNVVNNAKISGIAVFLQSDATPFNNPPVVTKPSDITLNIGQAWSYQVIASDPDAGDVLTYSASNLPASLTINASTGLISGNLSASAGTYTVSLSVSDQQGLSANTNFIITLINPNHPPVITKPSDVSKKVNQTFNYQVIASDPDAGDVLTYSASNLPSSLSINASTGLISGTVTASPASYTVSLSVSDQLGLSASTSFVFTVKPSNKPPVINQPANFTVKVNDSVNYQINASDPDSADVLSYSASNLPVSLSDQQGLTANTSFIITVNPPANQPPVITKPSDVTLTAGQSFTYQVIASDPDAGAVLTYAATDLPASLTIDAGTGFISGDLSVAPGTYTVALSVSDQHGLTANTSFIITVNPPANQPPTITSPGDRVLTIGDIWSYQVEANDPEDGQIGLVYSATNLPDSLTINASTGIISGKVTAAAGEYMVNLGVMDQNNLAATEVIFKITVVAATPATMSSNSLPLNESLRIQDRNAKQEKLSIYPNPVQKDFSVQFNVKDKSEWKFILYNTLGHVIQLPKANLEKGISTISFDLSQYNLIAGVYYLIMTNNLKEQKTSKIIIE